MMLLGFYAMKLPVRHIIFQEYEEAYLITQSQSLSVLRKICSNTVLHILTTAVTGLCITRQLSQL